MVRSLDDEAKLTSDGSPNSWITSRPIKPRPLAEHARIAEAARAEIAANLGLLRELGVVADVGAILGRIRVVDPRVADVAGYERVALGGHLLRDAQRVPVERLEVLLPSDHPQLLAVAVIGEGDHHLGAGAEELPMKLAYGVGKVEHRLRHERSTLHVAASLQLEEVSLG